MKEKYIQHLINKIINEAPVDYGDYPERMDPKTQSNIENPEKNLYGKNKAFRGGTSDVEKITSKRFKDIVDYVKRYYGIVDGQGRPNKSINITDPRIKYGIQVEQSRSVAEAMGIEASKKDELKDFIKARSLYSEEEFLTAYKEIIGQNKNVEVFEGKFQDVSIRGKYDLVFTSPPFYTKEKYEDVVSSASNSII
jgi:phosphohistidine swiveling domain-containing protein